MDRPRRIARSDYHWMSDVVAPIRRDIMPPDIAPFLAAHGEGVPKVLAGLSDAERGEAYGGAAVRFYGLDGT